MLAATEPTLDSVNLKCTNTQKYVTMALSFGPIFFNRSKFLILLVVPFRVNVNMRSRDFGKTIFRQSWLKLDKKCKFLSGHVKLSRNTTLI